HFRYHDVPGDDEDALGGRDEPLRLEVACKREVNGDPDDLILAGTETGSKCGCNLGRRALEEQVRDDAHVSPRQASATLVTTATPCPSNVMEPPSGFATTRASVPRSSFSRVPASATSCPPRSVTS